MADVVEHVMDKMDDGRVADTMDDIFAADGEARRYASEWIVSKEKAA